MINMTEQYRLYYNMQNYHDMKDSGTELHKIALGIPGAEWHAGGTWSHSEYRSSLKSLGHKDKTYCVYSSLCIYPKVYWAFLLQF